MPTVVRGAAPAAECKSDYQSCQIGKTLCACFNLQTPSSISGTISPQGQIVVPASALQQGNVTVTTVNPTQVVAGMSSWHTTPPSGTAVLWLLLGSYQWEALIWALSHPNMLNFSESACVSVSFRRHSLPTSHSCHSSGPGGNTGSVSWDNTRPKQSGTTSVCVTVMLV